MAITVRETRPADRPQAESLWKGISPYRPGDEAEVGAMHKRALRARDVGDCGWKSLEAMESDDLPPSCLENWVAAVPSGRGEDRVVGTVQVVSPTALSEMPNRSSSEPRAASVERRRRATSSAGGRRHVGAGHRHPAGGGCHRLVSRPRNPRAGPHHHHLTETRHRPVS